MKSNLVKELFSDKQSKNKIPLDDFSVRAKGLTKIYSNNFKAVNDVSFYVQRGECFAILGPNGAGKTTIIKMISCIYPKTSGTLRVLGFNTDKQPRKIKSMIGVVPQENSLDPDLTVIQNLLLYASYYDISRNTGKKRAQSLLDFFGLKDYRDKKISELSGGLKRRLTIARGLINLPDLLILDEPTTGLDPQARGIIWSLLENFKNLGITMILTTHYIEEAQEFADRVIIMDKGEIVAAGKVQELIEKYAREGVLEVSLNDNSINARKIELLKNLLNSEDLLEQTEDKIFIYTSNGINIAEKLKSMEIENIVIRKSTLQDVFIRLTGRELRD